MKSNDQVYTEAVKMIRTILSKCSAGEYPNICALKSIPNGEDKIVKQVIDIISKNPMPIESAVAQVESQLN